MAIRAAIKITGVDDILKLFDNAPANMENLLKKSMRDAVKVTSRHIRKAIPKRFRRLTKYRVGRLDNGQIYARAGLYGTKKNFDWFKAYWANYGTLKRRDPEHQFEYPIKPKTQGNPRRQSVGQPAQKFFETAIRGWEDTFLDAFEASVNKNGNELYKR